MNLRRKKPHDSLYMLLDTMCNAFGGIILLAVLVVLLTSKEKTSSSAAAENQELLQRRLAIAETNLQAAEALASNLNSQASSETWKQQVALLAARQELQSALQGMRDMNAHSSQDIESANAADPSERAKFLHTEFAAEEFRKAETQNRLAAGREKNTALTKRLADLNKQIVAKTAELQRQLRLPREHDSSKQVLFLIVRNGRIYPCRNADLSRNETDIKWTKGFMIETADPIAGRGMDPLREAAQLDAYLRAISSDGFYVAYCVFNDSFPAFIQAKQITVARGMTYAWEPFQIKDGYVSFSASGFTPRAQ